MIKKNGFLSLLFNRPVIKGQKYASRDYYNDPFNRYKYEVEILDVKDGWVLFKSNYLKHVSQDETMDQRTFHFCYRLLD